MSFIQAVLFDLDGTLIDSAPDLAAAADKMRLQRGLAPLGASTYRSMVGSGARGMLKIAFDLAPTDADFEAMKNEFLANYQDALDVHTRPFDGVLELLEFLATRQWPWGVVTNKYERFTHQIVARMGWLQKASTVICGDTTPHAKPHPEPLLAACRKLNLEPEACIYVGDDERDVQAGKAAGMRTVAARYGYLGQVTAVQHWGADFEIDSPRDLIKWLDAA